MPDLGRLPGFKILMFFRDENPPHVHIKGADFAAKLRISNGDLLAGRAPPRALRRAREWIGERRDELADLWDVFKGE
jgi:hypothetical protein